MSPSAAFANPAGVEIVDIHQNDMEFSLVDDIHKHIDPPDGSARSFPTLLLYDAKGLKLFEKITYLDDYYLTNAEIDVLTTNAKRIVERIPKNAQLVELGSGNLRKIEILLRECERTEKPVDYYALDLSLPELQRTFSEISPEDFKHVGFHGLHGTYDDALTWLTTPENRAKPTVIVSIGSSIGNFSRSGAAEFLENFSRLLSPSDFMLIGLDACKDPERVFKAYNDSEGVTRQFYENGLAHANVVLGFEAFKPSEWEIITAFDSVESRHHAFYSPKVDVTIDGITIPKGEKIFFEQSVKYGPEDRDQLWRKAKLIPQVKFRNVADDYHIHLMSPASLGTRGGTAPSQYAAHPVPGLEEFQSLWTTWDIVTKTMISSEELFSQPIKLRNALIFYLGHLPTFLDIHLTRALREKPTEPSFFRQIFERGIDPDVEDPAKCHSHSVTPEEWPALDNIFDYQDRVRNRVRSIYQNGTPVNDRCLGEALWISYEHEAMHLETFLYMLLQSDKVSPPLGVDLPNFEQIAQHAQRDAKPNEWFTIPTQTLNVGLDDADVQAMPKSSFGWDNEKPQRTATVHAFEAQARPITNGEYAKYLQANLLRTWPASWKLAHSNQGYSISKVENGSSNCATDDFLENFTVRTVFGAVPLKAAKDWPLMASYDEVAKYAEWMGCRIPTFEEVKSIYHYSAQLQAPTANGHSNGVDGPYLNGDKPRLPDHDVPVFRDLNNCNVGFKHWHPVPVTPNGNRLAGQGDMGGVWEWTSTPLMPHAGFKPMEIYPGYTADFFDGKHNIVLGSSWATHPRIAGRTSFVNWYQHNYLYAWAGARLVRDQRE